VKKQKLLMTIVLLIFLFVVSASVGYAEMYQKPGYPDYAPNGVPDFDQKQDNWKNAAGQWCYCGPVAVANSLWWLDSRYESRKFFNPVPPPAKSDHFPLVESYNPAWDDHDPQNVIPFVDDLAVMMGTNVAGTTNVYKMQAAIDKLLKDKGLDTVLYEKTLKKPTFGEVEAEVEKSEDVILLLGFWRYDPYADKWYRIGGHYVTVAGVDSINGLIKISDPFFDTPFDGTYGINHGTSYDSSTHNDAKWLSHDIYAVSTTHVSPGGLWELPEYHDESRITYDGTTLDPLDVMEMVRDNFYKQNVPAEFVTYQEPDPTQLPEITEVEYAVVISPRFVPTGVNKYMLIALALVCLALGAVMLRRPLRGYFMKA